GRRLWIAWTHRAIRDAEGTVREILCIGNDATERKRMEEALRYRAEFERIIAAASNEFISLPADRFDEGIQRILRAAGEFCGADRSYVFLRSDDGASVSKTHEWCRDGVEPHKALLQNIPIDSFPWAKAQLERLGAVHVRRIADLPPEAAAERRLFEELGMRSCVFVPIAFAGAAIGFLGFTSVRDERAWDEDTVALLRLAGEIFVSAWQRKKAEEALRAGEENYRRLFEYHPAACFTYDRDGIIRSWNREAERLYGYKADEVIGRSIMEAIASSDRDRQATAEVVARVFRGEAVSGVEWRDVGADGKPRWVLTNTFPVQDETGTVILGVSSNLDITARKRAEEALRSIVEGTAASTGADFFRSLVRHLAAALGVRYAFVGELQGDPADRVRTLAVWEGDRFGDNIEYPLAGTPCENVVGQTIRHYPSRVRELFPRDPLLAEMGVESYMGVPLFDTGGRPIGLLSVMHDRPIGEVPEAQSILAIFAARAGAELERQRAGEALEESEARFRTLTENSLTGVYVFREQRFLYVNPAFAKIFGYPRERILREFSPLDLIHPDDRPLVAERIRQRIEGELDTVHYTFRGVREDGTTIVCEALGRRIDYGGLPAVIGTLLDVTERRRAEEALRDSEARTRAILNTAADAIVTADEHGTIESFNPA
nr:PAS domain S-box protein [Phycisphaerae bacterium]